MVWRGTSFQNIVLIPRRIHCFSRFQSHDTCVKCWAEICWANSKTGKAGTIHTNTTQFQKYIILSKLTSIYLSIAFPGKENKNERLKNYFPLLYGRYNLPSRICMCKGQSSSRGSGLLLFNKLNCCPPQLSINKKKSIPFWQSGLENVMKTKANQLQNRQLTMENHTIPLRKTLRVARHEFVSKAKDQTAWL